MLKKLILSSKKIITVEENVEIGGFGSSILEYSSKVTNKLKKANIKIVGLEDRFVKKYGTQEELLDYNNINYKYLSNKMKNFIKE